jgi:hypothetical protein
MILITLAAVDIKINGQQRVELNSMCQEVSLK